MIYTNRIIPGILTSLVLLMPLIVFAEDGKAIFVIGKVQVQNANGEKSFLKRGSEVNSGDLIITSDKGQAQIKMADGTLLAIRPDSQFKISDYQYEHNIDSDKSVYNLVKGGFRSITGKMGKAKKSSYAVKTVVGTIGIRGTDFSARLCENNCNDQENGLYVGVMQGGVVLANEGGTLNVSPGDFGYMPDPAIQPSYLDSMPGDLLFAESSQSTDKTALKDSSSTPASSDKVTSDSTSKETAKTTLPITAKNNNGETIDLAASTIDELTEALKNEDITGPIADTTPDTTPVDTTPADPTLLLPTTGTATYTAAVSDTTLNTSAGIISGELNLNASATNLSVDFTNTEVNVAYEFKNVITNDAAVNTSWIATNTTPMTYDTTNGTFQGTLSGASTDTMIFPVTLTGTTSGSLVDTTVDIADAPARVATDFRVTDGNNTFDGTVGFSSPVMN